MEETILAILEEDAGKDVDWKAQSAIVDEELIDSLDMVAIISDLSEAFDVDITVDDMTPENFNSVAAMMQMITRLQRDNQ